MSAKDTLKDEVFIVAHGLNVQSVMEGEPWKRECEVLMAWQSTDGREWPTALPWLFISSTVAATGRVVHIQGGSPLLIYTSVEITPWTHPCVFS